MATKDKLQEKVKELEEILDGVKDVLGVTEAEETLQDIKKRLEEFEIEVPDHYDLADIIEELAVNSNTLARVKEALEGAGFELPKDDEELADAIREYVFTEEEAAEE